MPRWPVGRLPKMRIGWSTSGLMGLDTAREVATAVEKAAKNVTGDGPRCDGGES